MWINYSKNTVHSKNYLLLIIIHSPPDTDILCTQGLWLLYTQLIHPPSKNLSCHRIELCVSIAVNSRHDAIICWSISPPAAPHHTTANDRLSLLIHLFMYVYQTQGKTTRGQRTQVMLTHKRTRCEHCEFMTWIYKFITKLTRAIIN